MDLVPHIKRRPVERYHHHEAKVKMYAPLQGRLLHVVSSKVRYAMLSGKTISLKVPVSHVVVTVDTNACPINE